MSACSSDDYEYEGPEVIEYVQPDLSDVVQPKLSEIVQVVLYKTPDFSEAELKQFNLDHRNVQKALSESKGHQVPHHDSLRDEVYTKWLRLIEPAAEPQPGDLKHFLDARWHNQYSVANIPVPSLASPQAEVLRQAAAHIPCLHLSEAYGPETSIILGWNRNAVHAVARERSGHPEPFRGLSIWGGMVSSDEWDKEGSDEGGNDGSDDESDDEVEKDRAAQHSAYLASREGADKTIAGKYIVDCAEVEEGWDNVGEPSLSIRQTKLPGIYVANFDFGIFEGVMMLSANESALGYFCDKDEGCDDDSDTGLDDGVLGGPVGSYYAQAAGSKRKREASVSPEPVKPAKTARTSGAKPTTYHLCLRSRDTGTSEIHPDPEKGCITFAPDLTSFSGTMSLACVGSKVPFSGRKVSATPEISEGWEDYSWAAYEEANTRRWR